MQHRGHTMAAPRVERRLAAVLAADVVGYSRLMERDERSTFDRFKVHRTEVIEPLVAEHHGRIVKLTGDGALCEFRSIVDAVACAVLIQQGVGEREKEVPEETRIRLRIGVNLGDIILEPDGDIYGDGVNVAARLEGIADPGSVWISGTAYDHLQGKLDCGFEDLGERTVKNIERPVRVYRVIPGAANAPPERALALPDRPSIAVLPFNNMSADPEQEFFADGITEDITTALCKFRGFFVIARALPGPRYDLGLQFAQQAHTMRPGHPYPLLIGAACAGHLGNTEYARTLRHELKAVLPNVSTAWVEATSPYVHAEDRARLVEGLRRAGLS